MKTMKTQMMLMAMIIALSFSGCKKSSDPGPTGWNLTYLHAGYTKCWKMVEFYVNGVNIPVPSFALDNVFALNVDGTGVVIYGEVDKDPNDTLQCDHFKWTFDGDSLILDEAEQTQPDGNLTVSLISLSDDYWAYQYRTAEGDLVKVVYVSLIIPNPNAGTQNKALTHGLSKFWKVREATKDGQPYTIPEWRKDDLFLYNTDGTGYFTFGENVEFPGDTTNNDHFLWWFEDNYTRIEVEEFVNGGFVIEDLEIVTLNDSLLVYEGDITEQGVMHHMKITRVPLLK